MNGLANGLYGGITDQSLSGIDNGTGYGMANGAFGEPDNVVSIVRDNLRIHLDPYNYVIGSSTWNDLSGNGSNATLFNSPTYDRTNGGGFICNRGGSFNQYISIPSPGTFNNHSVSVWIKFNATFGNTSILEYGGAGQFQFRITDNTAPQVIISISQQTLTLNASFFSTNEWCNITLVRNGSDNIHYFYINGLLIQANSGLPVSRTDAILLSTTGVSSVINKTYGVFLFYTKPLNASEVLQNYNALKTRYTL